MNLFYRVRFPTTPFKINIMVNIDKDTLNKWINIDKLSYIEIGRRLECSIAYIKKYALKLGIPLPIRNTNKTPSWNKGKHKYNCINCGKSISSKGVFRKYCSIKCQKEYELKRKYQEYLDNQDKYLGIEIRYNRLKPIILDEQNNKCSICGMEPLWNNKEIHFILDHIDGDATNNIRTNLRLICPNCDSQLDTYKARNIGRSTRKYKPISYRNVSP